MTLKDDVDMLIELSKTDRELEEGLVWLSRRAIKTNTTIYDQIAYVIMWSKGK